MKRFIPILLFLIVPIAVRGQQKKALSAASSTCTATSCLTVTVDQTQGGATFTISNAAGNTIQFEASGDGGATIVSISATPSNSSTTATSTTSSGTWQVNTAGYTNLYLRMSNLVSGTTTVSIIQSTASARGGSGAGAAGTVFSGAAGDTTYYSGTNTLSPGTVVLDMAGIAGADLGAKMNNCDAQLPAAGGTCRGDNLTGTQTLSTAVTTTKATVFTFCGQAITQTAAITLAVSNSSLVGCPNLHTIITKAANLDQVAISAVSDNTVSYIDFEGVKAGFTGNGIVVNGASFTNIDHNVINGEAANAIDNEAGLWVFETYNNLTNWGTRAIFMNGTIDYADNNRIVGDGTATNNAITCTSCESTISHSWIQDSNAANLISQSASNPLVLTGNTLDQLGGFSGVNGAQLQMTNNVMFAGGASGDAIQATGISNIYGNSIFGQSGGNGITVSGTGLSVVSNNVINLTATTSKNGILITGDSIGNTVTGNSISIVDGGAASPHNNGIQMLTTSGHMLNQIISNNTINGTASVDGVWYNNNANLNTAANQNKVTFTSCTHTATCIKRTDTQNNANFYAQNTSDGTIYASGGSTADVIEQTVTSIAVASLPTAGAGSMVLDTLGKIHMFSGIGTATNCAANGTSANPSVVSCSAASAGMFSCAVAASTGTCQVNTTAVTANSEILITQDQADGGASQLNVTCNTTNVLSTTKPLLVSKSAGASFTINLGTVSVNPACFEFQIIN
jgi:hypothetical protein